MKSDKLFIDPDMPLDFIGFLEATAADCGITASLTPSAKSKEEKDYWPSINFQVQLTGDFPSSMKFLKKIESSPYLTDVNGVKMGTGTLDSASGQDGAAKRLVESEISLKVYTK